jgi:threonine dehydrogenase-like Zn-dependent dehydrogenase
MIGQVAALGAGRQTDSLGQPLREGDRVAYAYFHPCGSCQACAIGSTACQNRYAERAQLSVTDPPHFHGAFGDYYLLRGGQWVFKLPEGLSVDVAVPANCAVSQALYGVHRAGIKLGDTVVVQGLGGLGIYAAALARDMGAGRVIGVDGVGDRLRLAQRFGADEVIDINEVATPSERIELVRELSDGAGASAVIEMAGVPQVVPEGIEYLHPGGRYVLVGNVQAEAAAEIIPQRIVRSSRELVGVVTYPQWVLPRALRWLRAKSDVYPFEELVAESYRLEQINDAIEASDWAASGGNLGRAVVAMA